MLHTSFPLSRAQTVQMIAIGAALWFLAALLLAYLGPLGVYEGTAIILTYALIIPGTVPFLWAVIKLVRLEGAQIGLGIALATGTAILLDGIMFAWYPAFYGEALAVQVGAGGTILWGGGVAIFLGMLFTRSEAG